MEKFLIRDRNEFEAWKARDLAGSFAKQLQAAPSPVSFPVVIVEFETIEPVENPYLSWSYVYPSDFNPQETR